MRTRKLAQRVGRVMAVAAFGVGAAAGVSLAAPTATAESGAVVAAQSSGNTDTYTWD